MTGKQQQALDVLRSRLTAERGIASDAILASELDGKVHVTVANRSDFPAVTIGKNGGFDMPAIKSYPQDGVATALDACVFGDWHLARQQNGTRSKGTAYPYAVSKGETKATTAVA